MQKEANIVVFDSLWFDFMYKNDHIKHHQKHEKK